MKVAILAPVGFVIGLAGGIFLAKPVPAPPKAEPPGSEVSHGEGVPPTGEGATTTPVDPHATTPAEGAAPVAGGEVAPDTGAAHRSAPDTGKTAAGFDAKRLAKIFERLPATDIPSLVTQFSDDQVGQVLNEMTLDQAAAIVAAMPAERRAILSRRLITTVKKPL